MEKLIQLRKQYIIRFKEYWLLLAFILAAPGLLLAQADTTKKLKQINIPGYRAAQIPTQVPVQQISAQDFNRYSSLNVADAIRDFSGVNIKDYGGIGGLKTVSVRSLGANHLGVLYDGVELNDAANGQVDLGRINLNNIQSIQLYNGQPVNICQPARSFASANILAITTIRPKLDSIKPYQVQLGVNGGSFGLFNPYLQWQQRISRQWGFVANSYIEKANGRYKYRVSGDASDTASTRNNADVSIQQADAGLYWVKNEQEQFNLHVNYYNSDRGLPGAVVFYNPYSRVRLYDQDFFVQSGYQHSWKNKFHVLLNAKFSQNYTRYVDPDYLNGSGGLDQKYTEHEFYQSAVLAYDLTKNWQVSYAVDATLSNLATNLPNYAYPTRFTLMNVLASNFKTGRWFFEGSLLQTNISESVKSGNVAAPVSKLSPTVIAGFSATKNLQLRAFYKDIFRNPTFNEQYYFAVVQSRNIKPEDAKQFNVGLTYSKNFDGLLSYLTFTADGYHNTVTNKIIAIPNKNPVISSILNLGSVDIKGADIGLKTQVVFSPKYKAVFSANYTYQQALDVTDPASDYYKNQIPYTPQNTVTFNTGIIRDKLGIYYNQVTSTDRYFLSENQPQNLVLGYSVSDVSAVYNFNIKGTVFNLTAAMDNAFNANYVIVRSFPMPGRSVRFSIQITI